MKNKNKIFALIFLLILAILLIKIYFAFYPIHDSIDKNDYIPSVDLIPVWSPVAINPEWSPVDLNLKIEFDHPHTNIISNKEISLRYLEVLFDAFQTTSAENILFPDYFGGAYIDGNGELVILTTDIKAINDLYGVINLNKIEIREVQYSYNKMMEITYLIHDFVVSNNDHIVTHNIAFWEPNIRRNYVVVGLIENNQEQIDKFNYYVINSSLISFDQALPVGMPNNQ